jgi:hypothetical protein
MLTDSAKTQKYRLVRIGISAGGCCNTIKADRLYHAKFLDVFIKRIRTQLLRQSSKCAVTGIGKG